MLTSLTKSFGALPIQSFLKSPVQASLLSTNSISASAESPNKLTRAKVKKAPSALGKEASEGLKAEKPEKITVPPPPASRCFPFTLFLSENFAKFHKDGIKSFEVPKIAAQKFRELSSAELENLKLRATAKNRDCIENYTSWFNSLSLAQKEKYNAYLKKNRRLGNLVDPKKPKRPVPKFILFYIDNHKLPEFEGFSLAEKARVLGKKWAELGPTLKKKYEDLQAKSQAEYAKLSEGFSKKLSV